MKPGGWGSMSGVLFAVSEVDIPVSSCHAGVRRVNVSHGAHWGGHVVSAAVKNP